MKKKVESQKVVYCKRIVPCGRPSKKDVLNWVLSNKSCPSEGMKGI